VKVSTLILTIFSSVFFLSCSENQIKNVEDIEFDKSFQDPLQGDWKLFRTFQMNYNDTVFNSCIPMFPVFNYITVLNDSLWLLDYPYEEVEKYSINIKNDTIFDNEGNVVFVSSHTNDTLFLSRSTLNGEITEHYYLVQDKLDQRLLNDLKFYGVGWSLHNKKWKSLYNHPNYEYSIKDSVLIPQYIDLRESNSGNYAFSKDTLLYNNGQEVIKLIYYFKSLNLVFLYQNKDGAYSEPLSYAECNE